MVVEGKKRGGVVLGKGGVLGGGGGGVRGNWGDLLLLEILQRGASQYSIVTQTNSCPLDVPHFYREHRSPGVSK